MYSLITSRGKGNANFYRRPNVKKIWVLCRECRTGKWLTHRSKIYEPAIEYWTGQKIYSYLTIQYKLIKNEDSIETFVGYNLHSVKDNPAVIYANGTKEWYAYGHLNRVGEPAVVYSNGDVEYWYNGLRHRNNGPALIYGNKQYWFNHGEFIKCIQ